MGCFCDTLAAIGICALRRSSDDLFNHLCPASWFKLFDQVAGVTPLTVFATGCRRRHIGWSRRAVRLFRRFLEIVGESLAAAGERVAVRVIRFVDSGRGS